MENENEYLITSFVQQVWQVFSNSMQLFILFFFVVLTYTSNYLRID